MESHLTAKQLVIFAFKNFDQHELVEYFSESVTEDDLEFNFPDCLLKSLPVCLKYCNKWLKKRDITGWFIISHLDDFYAKVTIWKKEDVGKMIII